MIGQTPLVCFSKANSRDAISNIFQKKSKPLAKSLRTKQSRKSSYTIRKRLLDKRHGEHVKAKINA
jgi:hypothetical protein